MHESVAEGLSAPPASDDLPTEDVDVVIVGAGLGGLSCAGVLAKYGYTVAVVEAHYHAGGVAHGFQRPAKGGDGGRYLFDSGPSFWAGCGGEGLVNPLAVVLRVIEEQDAVRWVQYDGWQMYCGDGSGAFDRWRFTVGKDGLLGEVRRRLGAQGEEQLRAYQRAIDPVVRGAEAIPAFAVRSGLSAAVPLVGKYLPGLLAAGPVSGFLTGPASALMEKSIEKGNFLWRFLDFLSFALSGQPAEGTIGAATAYTCGDLFKEGCAIDYPLGGSEAVVDALVRGVRKRPGCSVSLGRRVLRFGAEGGRVNSVVVKTPSGEKTVRARKAVVSNADVWSTARLLREGAADWDEDFAAAHRGSAERVLGETPRTPSFMHLHVGIDAAGLPEDLDIHHSFVLDETKPIDAEDNVVLISIPSVLDPSLAPPGKHVVHAYTAGCTDFAPFADLDRRSAEYRDYKEARAEVLWRCLEQVIPDARERVEVELVGSPITHRRFNNRDAGTYGPGWVPGEGSGFPGADIFGVPGLYHCGDSCFPGIGIPAVAASGCIAANSIASVGEHWRLLSELQAEGVLP